jgi:hypothetical protein
MEIMKRAREMRNKIKSMFKRNKGMSKHRFALEMTWQEFGKTGPCPRVEDYAHTASGLTELMVDLGVRHFSVDEVIIPHHRDIAEECGFNVFLPPKECWEATAICLMIADEIREVCGSPVVMRNVWREAEYNRRVGGAAASDHVGIGGCMAVDLDFRSHEDRKKIDSLVEHLYDKEWLELSIGRGNAMWHIGCLSEKGKRRWSYQR